jgi:RNA polymerase sigma-32 factor
MREVVRDALEEVRPSLDDRELTILDARLFPNKDIEPRTLASLGGELGVTRERVRQIEAQLKKKLQRAVQRRTSARQEQPVFA